MKKVSVSATRGPQELIDIPSTVTVKDSDEIERELASDIKDLVRYEPGISVGNASTRFGLAGFNIRGIEGNRVATRIDGVRMNDGFAIGSFSDARRNLVDLDLLKAVEIVRGPASALYGSDAIGGVVSFVTKDPVDFLGADESSAFRVKSGYRSESRTWSLGGVYAVGSEELGALLSYRHSENEEGDNRGRIDALDNSRTKPNPQEGESNNLLAKLVWSPNPKHTVRFAVAADRDEDLTSVLSAQGRGAGAFANIFTVGLRGDDGQERTRFSLDHSIKLPTFMADELEWRVYRQETEVEQQTLEERYTFSTGPSSTVLRDRLFSFEQTLLGAEILARKNLSLGSSEHLLSYGLDLISTETEQLRNGVQTTLSSGAVTSNIAPDNFPVRDFPNTDTDQYALYFQDQSEFADGAFQLSPGVRIDYYKLTPKPDDIFAADNPGVGVAALKETSVSPKLGAIWRFEERYSLYANYARGFRAPPYNDVNIGFTNLAFGYTAIANPDLKPETSNGYEMGLRGIYTDGSSGHGFFSFAGFYNDYKDFINSLTFIGVQGGLQVFQSQNLSEAHVYGVELRGGVRLLDSFRVRSSVAYARGSGRNVGQADQSLNSVDPLKGVVGVTYQPGKTWSVELVTTAVARHKHVNQTTPQFVPAGYVLLDLLAHAQFGEHVQFNVGVFNLTDKVYWEWADVRGLSPSSAVLDRSTRPGINAGANIAVQY